MRALAAAVLLLTTLPAATAEPALSDGEAADGWGGTMLDPADSYTLQVSKRSHLVLTLVVTNGHWDGLTLDGPGACQGADLGGGQVLPGGTQVTHVLDCGVLRHGRYTVQVGVGFGAANGRLEIRGARMAH